MNKKLWEVSILDLMLATPDSSAIHERKSLSEKKIRKMESEI